MSSIIKVDLKYWEKNIYAENTIDSVTLELKFWEENIYAENTTDSVTLEFHTWLDEMTHEISERQLNEESKGVVVLIEGYLAKTLSSRSDCNEWKEKLIFSNKDNGHNHDKYLRLLSRDGLTVPSLALTDFIFQSFSILHYTSPT